MKAHALINKKGIEKLFDHIIDGFAASRVGIINLYNHKLISINELVDLLHQNEERLLARIKEFKITNKLVSVFFAALFTWLQVGGEDLDMRRSSRARGRRKNQTEQTPPPLV